MPFGHVVVALVAQHADELGGERLVEYGDHALAVGAVGLGDRALVDVGAGVFPEGLDVGEMVTHGTATYPLPGRP